MKPAVDGWESPVRVLTIRELADLTDMRVRELRAKGIPYEVIHLDGDAEAGGRNDGGHGRANDGRPAEVLR